MALCIGKQWAACGSWVGYDSAMLPQPPRREMRKTMALQKRGKIMRKARRAKMSFIVSVSMVETIA
jgi:hypothetical protein